MRKRILHIIIIFCLVTILLIDVVSALSLSVFMTPSTTSVETSSEVIIKVKISNLDVGDNGINTFSGNLSIDTDVFEQLSAESVTGLNNWTASYSPDNGRVTLFKTTFVNSDEELFQIILKTKSNVTKNSGTVSLKNIIVSNGNDEISATEVSTSISIGTGVSIIANNTVQNKVNSLTPNTNTNNLNVSKNSSTNSSGILISNNSNTSNYSNYSNTKNNNLSVNKNTNTNTIANNFNNNSTEMTNNSVPYTGTRENIRIALIILLIIAGYIYIKFEKINKIC
ncbi:MAG: hypothetical protein ACI4UE_03840 [Candidatus Scatovivens sp.]